MRVAVPGKAAQQMIRWSQRVLLGAAAVMLGYCAFALADSWNFQRLANRAFDRQLQPAAVSIPASADMGGLVGRLEIPRLGVSMMIAEGTAEATLRRAGGHIRGTALPGLPGNVGIAGHRDTLFRPLRNIRQNDLILLTTLQGEYRYRVVLTEIVSPDDVAVLTPDGHEILTLVTCHPFYFVGPAPNRFIVRAERIT
jgi:sortase A